MFDLTKYDFIDFGCSNGGSFSLAKRLGGRWGLGLDKDPKKIAKASKYNCNVLTVDATTVILPHKSVRFCVMSHFLEHLPTNNLVEKVIRMAVDTSKEFIFIQGPYFDADHKLRKLGLKLYWSDWHGHPARPTGTLLRNVFNSLGLPYRLYGYMPIANSSNPCVLPVGAPTDSFSYNKDLHGNKPHVSFSFPVYREIVGGTLVIKIHQ